MSAQASAWAWEVQIEPRADAQGTVSVGAQRFVLVCIADHAWPDGSHAWPGIDRLAARCSVSDRQVQRCLRALVAQGLLLEERPATNRLPAMYRLPVDNPSSTTKHLRPRGEATAFRGEGASPKPIVNPGSYEDAHAVSEPVDDCGCRWNGESYDRCADHGGVLTPDDRERILKAVIPPRTERP